MPGCLAIPATSAAPAEAHVPARVRRTLSRSFRLKRVPDRSTGRRRTRSRHRWRCSSSVPLGDWLSRSLNWKDVKEHEEHELKGSVNGSPSSFVAGSRTVIRELLEHGGHGSHGGHGGHG